MGGMKEPRCTVCDQPYTVPPRRGGACEVVHRALGAQVKAAPDLAREVAEWREANDAAMARGR